MKKYTIYLALVVVGILVGWLIFGGSTSDPTKKHEHATEEKAEQIWTCSMHPQIRRNEPGDCPICGMTLIPAKAEKKESLHEFAMTEEAVKLANVQTTTIGSASQKEGNLLLSGKIQSDETMSSSIVAHISGRVERLFITFTGQKISKGQKVASLYSPQLISAQKELLEANKIKNTNPKLYEAAENKLKNWKISDAQIQSILESEKIIENFNIYAEYSGVVVKKNISVGDYVKAGEELFEIQGLNKVWAVFDAYESDLTQIEKGDKINFKTSTYPDKTFAATINFIDPFINPSTRTVAIRASVSNLGELLKPDMFIEGSMGGMTESSEVLYVPKTAVLWTGERSVVYLKVPNDKAPTFEYREIQIEETGGSIYKVISGLKGGDVVVTNGAFVIDAAAQLNNQSSMMNKKL